jgi:hypothetical protein
MEFTQEHNGIRRVVPKARTDRRRKPKSPLHAGPAEAQLGLTHAQGGLDEQLPSS